MKILALAAVVAVSWTGLAYGQAPPRPAVTVSKVVASIPDGTQWATIQAEPFCNTAGHLQWNVGKGGIDVSRLAQPVRDEFRREGVRVAADPSDPFGNLLASDLVVGATITQMTAKLCGGEDVKGDVEIHVVWAVYSNAQKRVVGAFRTTGTGATKDKAIPPLRLIGLVMGENAKQLQANDTFHKLLLASAGAASGAALPGEAYGPQAMRNAQDVLPRAQDLLALSGSLAARGAKIGESISGVVSILHTGSSGTGFIVSADGYLLTAAHVVGNEKYVKIRWSDDFETTGQVIRTDARRDVALVKTDPRGRRPLALKLQSPQPGDVVYAIGAPYGPGLQGSVTRGIVSADRALNGFSFIQSDVTVNPGNSGGPLLNEAGEVLGVADLSRRGAGGATGSGVGINFFVPIADALLFLSAEQR